MEASSQYTDKAVHYFGFGVMMTSGEEQFCNLSHRRLSHFSTFSQQLSCSTFSQSLAGLPKHSAVLIWYICNQFRGRTVFSYNQEDTKNVHDEVQQAILTMTQPVIKNLQLPCTPQTLVSAEVEQSRRSPQQLLQVES